MAFIYSSQVLDNTYISFLKIAKIVVEAAIFKKGEDLLLLNVSQLVSYTDFFLLISGYSTRQITAISEYVLHILKKNKIKPLGFDGVKEGRWALIDLGGLIIHIFYRPVRELYNLESLWEDAPRILLDEVT